MRKWRILDLKSDPDEEDLDLNAPSSQDLPLPRFLKIFSLVLAALFSESSVFFFFLENGLNF